MGSVWAVHEVLGRGTVPRWWFLQPCCAAKGVRRWTVGGCRGVEARACVMSKEAWC